ncbi:MAG: hypothetical protein C4524_11565 [Candidatus Zixiibacteriota bacterium]|nr:MAG: hypothetical protein C4524_11565 [candidate division Zixibacteria bacterium]
MDDEFETPGSSPQEDDGAPWWKRLHLVEILVFLAVLLGLKVFLGKRLAREAKALAHSTSALGRAVKDWAVYMLTRPWIVWSLRIYFFFLPLLALIFWIIGLDTLAYALLLVQMTVVVLTTYALSTFIRHGKRRGFFWRLVVDVNILEFLILAGLAFIVALPGGLLDGIEIITLLVLLLALIPLSVIVQARWTYGWVALYVLAVLPLILQVAVPEGLLNAWIGERDAWQGYRAVVLTEPLRAYAANGRETGFTAAAGETVYVNFNRKVRLDDLENLHAFRCYTDYLGGDPFYLPLIREVNYRKINISNVMERDRPETSVRPGGLDTKSGPRSAIPLDTVIVPAPGQPDTAAP